MTQAIHRTWPGRSAGRSASWDAARYTMSFPFDDHDGVPAMELSSLSVGAGNTTGVPNGAVDRIRTSWSSSERYASHRPSGDHAAPKSAPIRVTWRLLEPLAFITQMLRTPAASLT